MQVKKFNIPSFEEWICNGREFKEKIGDYTCKIAIISVGCNGNTNDRFNACVANYDNPTNFNVKKVFSKPLECDREDLENMKEWYDSLKEELNNTWEKYIIDTYFE